MRTGNTVRTRLCCALQQGPWPSWYVLPSGSFSRRPCGFGVMEFSSYPVRLQPCSSMGPDLFGAEGLISQQRHCHQGRTALIHFPLSLRYLQDFSLCYRFSLLITWANVCFHTVPTYMWIYLIYLHSSVRQQDSSLKPVDPVSSLQMPGPSAAPLFDSFSCPNAPLSPL